MVSRAGRSRGCSNCRRRRIKCDESRPACNRCIKRGLVCTGPKEATWIIHTTAPRKASNHQLISTLPETLSFIAFQDDLCLAFTRKHLLRGGPVEVAWDRIQARSSGPGGSTIPGLDLLEKAILSLSVTFFGRRHRQLALENRGYKQYGLVLRELNVHMSDTHFASTDAVILASTTCMLLEIFLPTGPANFLTHLRGVEAMLEKRGPPASPTCEFALIVQNLWAVCIVGALVEGRPSLLAKSEWKSLPPVDHSQNAVLKRQLWVVMADCTLATHECDQVIATGIQLASQQLHLLVRSLENMLRRLQVIYLEWQIYNTRLKDNGIAKVDLNTAFPFGNHASATTYMLCKTAKLHVLRLIMSVRSTPDHAELLLTTAADILRTLELEYFLKRQGSSESNTIGFIATKLVWETIGGLSSPEGRKLAVLMREAVDGEILSSAWEYVRSKMAEHSIKGVYDTWFTNGTQHHAESEGSEQDLVEIGHSALITQVGPPDGRRPCSEDWLPGEFVCSETSGPLSTAESAPHKNQSEQAILNNLSPKGHIDSFHFNDSSFNTLNATVCNHVTNVGDLDFS